MEYKKYCDHTMTNMDTSKRNFLDLHLLSRNELQHILAKAHEIKSQFKKARLEAPKLLEGQILASIFEKPSTRTRVSFDVAMRQLGGESLTLGSQELQLGRGETIPDTAKVLSRYVDIIMLRTSAHKNLTDLAEFSDVPVVNGLTDQSHPCQILADIMTFEEKRGSIENKKVVWIGDCNNVANSFIHAACRLGFQLIVANPEEFGPSQLMQDFLAEENGDVEFTRSPIDAAIGADLIVTDTWVSMGDEDAEQRLRILQPYQVNQELMARADKEALFMHCLPAYRGHEVTQDVLEGPQSVVYDEAENRLHIQKAILAWALGAI